MIKKIILSVLLLLSFITTIYAENIYYTPNSHNAKLREKPSLESKLIRSLKTGEHLKLLETGNNK